MILPVIQQPNPILRQKCQPVTKVTPEIKQIVNDMVETMYNFHGVGLAAPQVGYSVQVIVFDATNLRSSNNFVTADINFSTSVVININQAFDLPIPVELNAVVNCFV